MQIGNGFFTVTIKLPGVSSIAEAELDISKDEMVLRVGELYALHLVFPSECNDTAAKAKFNKSTHTLALTLPLLNKM